MRGGEEITVVERSKGFNASSTSLVLAASKQQQSSAKMEIQKKSALTVEANSS